jgi:hypothetical protein
VIDEMNRRVGKRVNGTLVAGWIYSDALHIVADTHGTTAFQQGSWMQTTVALRERMAS